MQNWQIHSIAKEKPMASQPEITNMALLCDVENITLCMRDEKPGQYTIRLPE